MLNLMREYSSRLLVTSIMPSAIISFSLNSKSLCRTLTQKAEKEVGVGEEDLVGDVHLMQKADLHPDLMPKHIAIILDGNRRSSVTMNRPVTYEYMFRSFAKIAELCVELGIPVASVFVFSTCTWKRPQVVTADILFREMKESLEDNLEKFIRKGIKVSIIGEKWKLPIALQDAIKEVEEATKDCKTLDLKYAVPYGGRWDIVEAGKCIIKKVKDGVIDLEDINEALVEQELSGGNVPGIDLIFRNGGKHRISNFYLWQASYAELYFTNHLPHEFEEAHFINALHWYQRRQRRFGK